MLIFPRPSYIGLALVETYTHSKRSHLPSPYRPSWQENPLIKLVCRLKTPQRLSRR